MQEETDRPEEKHPRDMTSDELLDYAIAPEVAKRLKERVRDEPPDDCDERND